MIRGEDLYHTGIVVPDLDAAMARLSALAGYRWINPLTYTLPFRTASGTHELTSTFVYSLQAPHVELIQEVPGSPWTAAPGNSIHHLGYFTDSLADSQIVEEASLVGVPVIALASTDNSKSNVDLVIPMNNKGRRALAIAFWLIAREILKERSELPVSGEMKYSIDDFETS